MDGLNELLHRHVPLSAAGRDGFFDIAAGKHCSPGFWTAYVARARARQLGLADLAIPEPLLSYAKAIAIEHALGHGDSYQHRRRRAGVNYSPLVLLESLEQTDVAVGEINSCIRRLFGEPRFREFAASMCELVGDLFDNVWAHGMSTGFSMAQKWRNRNGGFHFEFAVADCGYGFLRELRRVGRRDIEADRDAIAWCIQRGNSTKRRTVDEWAQRLPPDVMGNPIPGVGRVVDSDNHHMGLGLAKLVENVERFNGQLWLASGEAMLHIHPDRERRYEAPGISWQGVALACRFDSDRVLAAAGAGPIDEFQDMLESLLKGSS